MTGRKYDVVVALVVLSCATMEARAGFIFTDAERELRIDLNTGGGPQQSIETIPGFGALNESLGFDVPGASGDIIQFSTIEDNLIDGNMFVMTDTSREFAARAQSTLEVHFDLDALTTVSMFMFFVGYEDAGGDIKGGSWLLERETTTIFSTEVGFEETMLDLEPGSYSLTVSVWIEHTMDGLTAGRGNYANGFGFAIVPAPATLALLPFALACGGRRRRRNWN